MKKFIYMLLGTFAILSIIYATFIVIIDPFYVFHMPIGQMEAVKTNRAHYVARGLIRNADYDMLICGSSMCENFHINDANEIFYGGEDKCLKVIQHGSYSNDLRASLEAAEEVGKAEVIIMALDTAVFQKPDQGYRSEMPAYTTEKLSFVNIWPYLLSKDVFKYSLDLIFQNKKGNLPSEDSWWITDEDLYSEQNVLNSYNNEILSLGFREFDEQKAWNNLRNIEKGIEACLDKGIRIQFFIPPYSVASWDCKDYRTELMTYKEIWEELLNYSNVSIYAVQFDEDIITNFNNYKNQGHYSEEVCHTILQDIKQGRHQLTTDNIDSEVDGFIKLLDEYDWENLRKRAKGLI